MKYDRGQFTSPGKFAEKPIDFDINMVSDNEFNCFDKSHGMPVHRNIEDELLLHPQKSINLTLDSCTHNVIIENEPIQPVGKLKKAAVF